jgi:hypothetical protein
VSTRTGGLIRFFNPRSDAWRQHFQWNESRIEPLTDIGQVTARLLDFDHRERVAFRKLLAETGRYPSVDALARLRE